VIQVHRPIILRYVSHMQITFPLVRILTTSNESGSSGSDSSRGVPAVHPLLQYDRAGRLHFDITQPPRYILFRRPADIRELAFYPPVSLVYIRVPGQRAWSFSVENPRGITLKDVMDAIYQQMQWPLPPSEFMKLQDDKRSAAARSYQTRTANDPVEYGQGVRRLDCLHPNVLFVGLSLDIDGVAWNLNFASGY